MVDVTRSNFREIYRDIIDKIDTCSFIAIDAEFTGIFAANSKDSNNLFDTGQIRYNKLKNNLSRFTVPQFGISFFEKKLGENKFELSAYNFYLFPLSFDNFARREDFRVQVSSLNFLTSNNFDYNKFIKEGIPFVNKPKEKELLKFLIENPGFMHNTEYLDKNYFPKKYFHIQEEDAEDICNDLTGFTLIIRMITESEKPIVGHNMMLDLILSFHLFNDELPKDYKKFKEELHKLFPLIYDTKVIANGIRRAILENPTNANNPIKLGMLNDLNKTALEEIYKKIIKIQYISNIPQIDFENEETREKYEKDFDLNKPFVKASNEIKSMHEAGFDSSITGILFLKLIAISLYTEDKLHVFGSTKLNSKVGLTFVEMLSQISKYANCVNLGRANIPYVNVVGEDPPSLERPKWICLQSIKRNPINVQMLKNELHRFGDLEISIENPSRIIIACGGGGCARNVLRHLENKSKEKKEFQISLIDHTEAHYIRKLFNFEISKNALLKMVILGVSALIIWRKYGKSIKLRIFN